MARARRRPTQINGPFAPRTIEMLESPAMRVLSLSGRRLLDRLEIEMARHGGKDNARLPCTYDDFVRFGIERHAIAPAIRECVALGLLEVTEQGRAGNAEYRAPNHFRLTYRHTEYLDPTDEWKRINSVETAQRLATAARRAGKKQKPSAGKPTVSVRETHTENATPQ